MTLKRKIGSIEKDVDSKLLQQSGGAPSVIFEISSLEKIRDTILKAGLNPPDVLLSNIKKAKQQLAELELPEGVAYSPCPISKAEAAEINENLMIKLNPYFAKFANLTVGEARKLDTRKMRTVDAWCLALMLNNQASKDAQASL